MNILVVRSFKETEEGFDLLAAADRIGCDTETSGLDPSRNKLLSVQFSDGKQNIFVPISEGIGLGRLAEILTDNTITKIFHNARFDLGFLAASKYTVENFFDTMIAEKVLTKGAGQSVSLAETLYRYFAVDLDKSQRNNFGNNWNGRWTNELVRYAMNDVVYLSELMGEQISWLERLGLTKEYESKLNRIS